MMQHAKYIQAFIMDMNMGVTVAHGKLLVSLA
jgi:hypothetical protein